MSNLRYYVTVGVPGGEYAAKGAQMKSDAAAKLVKRMMVDMECTDLEAIRLCEYARPAPPELAEWATVPMGKWQQLSDAVCRRKVEGGWLYYFSDGGTPPVFVTVALASGITVIEDGE